MRGRNVRQKDVLFGLQVLGSVLEIPAKLQFVKDLAYSRDLGAYTICDRACRMVIDQRLRIDLAKIV